MDRRKRTIRDEAGVVEKFGVEPQSIPDYLALVNTPVGYSAVDLARSNTGDNMMATFIDDAIYDYLNGDAEPAKPVGQPVGQPRQCSLAPQ